MLRALQEFRIRGVSNNLAFINVITIALFTSEQCTTRFIDATSELFQLEA